MYYPNFNNFNNNFNNPYGQQGGIVWVQGEAGAKSYMVGAGNSVLLMDSEKSTFYIKSTDASGMPLPLRIFDYSERREGTTTLAQPAAAPSIDLNNYVTKDELKKALDKIKTPSKTAAKE